MCFFALSKVSIETSRRTADWLGVEFHPVHMDEPNLASRFEDAVWYSETPFPDLNGIGKLALSEKVHSLGTKVVLTGLSIVNPLLVCTRTN